MIERIFEPGRADIATPSEEEKLRKKIEQDRQRRVLQAVLDLIDAETDYNKEVSNIIGTESLKIMHVIFNTFIAVGVYSGNGPHRPFSAAVRSDVYIDRNAAAERIARKFPKGLATIPYSSTQLPGTSQGELVAYWCYGVPPKFRTLIDWKTEEI